jgi:hypothetical protein
MRLLKAEYEALKAVRVRRGEERRGKASDCD